MPFVRWSWYPVYSQIARFTGNLIQYSREKTSSTGLSTDRHWNVNKDQSVRQVIANRDCTFAAIIAFAQKAGTAGLCLTLLVLTAGTLQAQIDPNSDPGATKSGAGTAPTNGGAQPPAASSTSQPEKAMANDPEAKKTMAGKKAMADNPEAKRLMMEIDLEKRREAAMQIRKPLLEPNAIERYNRGRFLSIMRSGFQAAGDKKVFDESLRYRVLEMAEEGNFRNAGDLRIRLLRDLRTCGSQINGPNAKKKFSQETMGKVVALAVTMLDNQLTVRINAAHLIGRLDLESGAVKKQPVPYVAGYETLLEVVKNKKQLPSVKIAAVSGLQRILHYGSVANVVQDGIGDELMKEAVKGNPAFPWLDEKICAAMAEVKTTKDARVKGLVNIMGDSTRQWRVRSAAAYAIGRTGWPPKDADMLAYQVTQLMHQMTVAYNKNPRNTNLILYSFRCYLAYHHDTGEDKNEKIGFLKRAATAKVQQSFQRLVAPTVNEMINRPGNRVSAKMIDAQSKWLKENSVRATAANSR